MILASLHDLTLRITVTTYPKNTSVSLSMCVTSSGNLYSNSPYPRPALPPSSLAILFLDVCNPSPSPLNLPSLSPHSPLTLPSLHSSYLTSHQWCPLRLNPFLTIAILSLLTSPLSYPPFLPSSPSPSAARILRYATPSSDWSRNRPQDLRSSLS